MNNYNYFLRDWYRMNNNLYRAQSQTKNQSQTSKSLFTPQVAYDNGNLFSNIYDQYKNFKPTSLTGNDKRSRLWLELARMSFAAHEVNLYLDVYPNDSSMLTLFNDYRSRANKLAEEYENKYGPLNISNASSNEVPFSWENTTWPWEGDINV